MEEAREDALEMAQEADATPEARAEVAEAVRTRPRSSGRKLHRRLAIPHVQGDVG